MTSNLLSPCDAATTFDQAAVEYDRQLQLGISLSGESPDYFVEGRVTFLTDFLISRIPLHNLQVLDFGCGIGNACGSLRERLHAAQVIGLDCSPASIEQARQRYSPSFFEWTLDGHCIEPNSLDVVYTAGVFHHIEPKDRQRELERIFGWLKPGGYFALFENNPWNVGTRLVMSRIPFDADAKCLSLIESRRRMRAAGFELDVARSLFYFPRFLKVLRPFEHLLSAVPLGAQYVVIGQRPH